MKHGEYQTYRPQNLPCLGRNLLAKRLLVLTSCGIFNTPCIWPVLFPRTCTRLTSPQENYRLPVFSITTSLIYFANRVLSRTVYLNLPFKSCWEFDWKENYCHHCHHCHCIAGTCMYKVGTRVLLRRHWKLFWKFWNKKFLLVSLFVQENYFPYQEFVLLLPKSGLRYFLIVSLILVETVKSATQQQQNRRFS